MRRPSAIHAGLVGARELVGTRYLADPKLRAEYVREIAPRTEAALARVLDEVYGRAALSPPARALDLGAGTGAVSRALRARFGDGLEIVSVDLVAEPGVVRADLSRELPAVGGRFDLIVAAHLLNELFVDRPPASRAGLRAARVTAWARALLAPGGSIIVIEPALRETSRALLAVRDLLLAGGLRVVAPCIWTGPCPALAAARDWCHDAAPGEGGARVDFSYLVLRDGGPPVAAPGATRVVSDLLRDKGRARLYGCGGDGRHAFVRLDRHASAANAAFEDGRRGDLLRIEGAEPARDGRRVTAAARVTAAGR